MHRAVVGHVYSIFAEATEAELLNVRRSDVEMSLAVGFEIHQKLAPVAERFLVTIDHIFSNLVTLDARGRSKRGYTVASIDALKQHHVGNGPLDDASGSSAPAGMDRRHRAGLRVADKHRQAVGRLYPEQNVLQSRHHRIALWLRAACFLRRFDHAARGR